MTLNLMNDVNLLAANNVVGYDTYSNTFAGVNPFGRNPYGGGRFNTGVMQDTFCRKTPSQAVTTGFFTAVGAGLGLKVLGKLKGKGEKVAKTATKATKTARKATAKGIKGVMGKLGKAGKIGIMAVGIGTIASAIGKFAIQKYNMANRTLSDSPAQPQQTEYNYVEE